MPLGKVAGGEPSAGYKSKEFSGKYGFKSLEIIVNVETKVPAVIQY